MLAPLSSSYFDTQLPLKRPPCVSVPAPRKNGLLEGLPPAHYERLTPYLQLVPLPLGLTIYGAGEPEKYLYFIVEGLVSLMQVTAGGASAQSAVTGREGVIGIASFLGGESTPTQSLVVSAGRAYRLPSNILKSEIASGGPLLQLLLRYTQFLIAQCGQMALCNLHHSLEQRLCCWLSSSVDRLPGNELTVTHAQLGELLGVRREGVTEAIGKLEQQGIILHGRGRVTVLSRPRLEALACECRGMEKREFERPLRAPQLHPQQPSHPQHSQEMLHVSPRLHKSIDAASRLELVN